MPETCRVLWQNKFWIFDASSWLFYTKLVTMYGHLNIKEKRSQISTWILHLNGSKLRRRFGTIYRPYLQGSKQNSRNMGSLKMGATGCPETSVNILPIKAAQNPRRTKILTARRRKLDTSWTRHSLDYSWVLEWKWWIIIELLLIFRVGAWQGCLLRCEVMWTDRWHPRSGQTEWRTKRKPRKAD
jgi:hypothetical protein